MMNGIGKCALEVLGCLGEFGTLNNDETYKDVIAFLVDRFSFGLLIYSPNECLITFLKLNVKEQIYEQGNVGLVSDVSCSDGENFKVNLLNVFNLPFTLLKVIYTCNNVWAIGHESVVDLKPYIESILEKAKIEENVEFMDVDDIEKFHHEMFDVPVTVQHVKEFDFYHEDIFIGCNFSDCDFIRCFKNSDLSAWILEVILLEASGTKMSELASSSFLELPVVPVFTKGQKDLHTPVINFVHHNDFNSHILRAIFGINCPSSNVICLIGHPDGKILWSLCNYKNQFHSSQKLLTLYDIKQPVIGIYFVKEMEELEGYGCMLVIGALGQVTLFSSKKHPSLTLIPGQHPYWISSVNLKSSISDFVVVKDCLSFILSNETLWSLDISRLLCSKEEEKELCLALDCAELSCVQKIVVVDKSQGLVCLTSSGNIYLAICQNKFEADSVASSLPPLMNKCLQLSTVMQDLLSKKVMQNRFFSTVTAFASLKFYSNALKESINFNISEVNFEPKKYILVINYSCLKNLHFDPELCHISATVFTYFERNFSLVSKTAPFITDQPSLCLELTDTVLQPPFVSIFPLFVEVGLILQLPNNWKTIDCFKSVSYCLPFYLRVQTFMVHELHLYQRNVLCPAQSFRCEKPRAIEIIEELAMKRPISNILHAQHRKKYELPLKFNLFLSASSVEEMMKSTSESEPAEYIRKLLYGSKHSNCIPEGTTSIKNPVSVDVIKQNGGLVLTLTSYSFESLIGLRIAVMDLILTTRNQSKHLTTSSTYVSVPASIYRKCENISKSLMSLYGKDVESDEVMAIVIQLYQELRRDISAKLPVL